MNDEEFREFPKIARLSRAIIVTEKIDGTNAQIYIDGDGNIIAGSRNRWLTPDDDNFGFSRWVESHHADLLALGPGRHYGEWWGCGINRGYHLAERRFSLFNTSRWADDAARPACCHVVPVLYRGPFLTEMVDACLGGLAAHGSKAAPGYPDPEGVVVFHTAGNLMLKKTIMDDSQPKQVGK